MKKSIIFGLTLLSALVMRAQTVTGYVPEGLTDWIQIEGNNINLRKAPSATAPRLMWSPSSEYGDPIVSWGQKETANLHPEQPLKGQVYLMLDRNHDYNPRYDDIPKDAELWVKIAYIYFGEEYPVWVKQEFTNRMPLTPLTADNYMKNGATNDFLYIRKGGKYDGLCFFWADIIQSDTDPEGLFVGKIDPSTGIAVLPLRYSGYFNSDDALSRFEVKEYGVFYPSNFEIGIENESRGAMVPDLSRLTDDDITKLLKKCEMQDTEILLFNNPFVDPFEGGGYLQFNVDTRPDKNGKREWCGSPLKKVTLPLSAETKSTSRAGVAAKDEYIETGSHSSTAISRDFNIDDVVPDSPANNKIYTAADTPPSFPGGMGAMLKWMGNNIHYPESAQTNNIQGRVLVKFAVYSDGTIGKVQVAKGVDKSLDDEAVRLVSKMPKWEPAQIDGRPVNSWYTVPVTFKLH